MRIKRPEDSAFRGSHLTAYHSVFSLIVSDAILKSVPPDSSTVELLHGYARRWGARVREQYQDKWEPDWESTGAVDGVLYYLLSSGLVGLLSGTRVDMHRVTEGARLLEDMLRQNQLMEISWRGRRLSQREFYDAEWWERLGLLYLCWLSLGKASEVLEHGKRYRIDLASRTDVPGELLMRYCLLAAKCTSKDAEASDPFGAGAHHLLVRLAWWYTMAGKTMWVNAEVALLLMLHYHACAFGKGVSSTFELLAPMRLEAIAADAERYLGAL